MQHFARLRVLPSGYSDALRRGMGFREKIEWLLIIVTGLLLLFGESTRANDLPTARRSRPGIAALISAEDDAWNRGDAQGFSDKALPDVVFTNVVGLFSVGKAPFLAQHERIFATIYKGSALHQAIQQITMLTPNIAIVDTLASVTGATHAPPGVDLIDGAIRTRLEQVLVHRADGWRVASFHNVAVNPATTANATPPAKP